MGPRPKIRASFVLGVLVAPLPLLFASVADSMKKADVYAKSGRSRDEEKRAVLQEVQRKHHCRVLKRLAPCALLDPVDEARLSQPELALPEMVRACKGPIASFSRSKVMANAH